MRLYTHGERLADDDIGDIEAIRRIAANAQPEVLSSSIVANVGRGIVDGDSQRPSLAISIAKHQSLQLSDWLSVGCHFARLFSLKPEAAVVHSLHLAEVLHVAPSCLIALLSIGYEVVDGLLAPLGEVPLAYDARHMFVAAACSADAHGYTIAFGASQREVECVVACFVESTLDVERGVLLALDGVCDALGHAFLCCAVEGVAVELNRLGVAGGERPVYGLFELHHESSACISHAGHVQVGQIVAQVWRLVVGRVLPADAHTIGMVMHQGGHTVVGGCVSRVNGQAGLSVAGSPEDDLLTPVAQNIGREVGRVLRTVASAAGS